MTPAGKVRAARAAVATGVGGLVAGCLLLATTPNLVEDAGAFLRAFTLAAAGYGVGLLGLRALDPRRVMWVTLAVALACRVILWPTPPTLSTDAYRYVWDARVARAGLDPYRYAPWDPALEGLRDRVIFPRLNHPTWPTLYPPAAHAFFRAVYWVAPDSLPVLKLALGVVELAGLAALAVLLRGLRLPPWRLAIYAWNPLLLVEGWGSAHADVLAVTGVILAVLATLRGRSALAGSGLALATLAKLYPAALLPLLARSVGPRVTLPFGILVALAYLPLTWRGSEVLGSLPRYLAEERFNPGLVRSVLDWPPATLAVLAAWIAWASLRRSTAPLADRAVTLVGGVTVLLPNVFPWYALWLVPLLAMAPSVPWIAFTISVAFAYAFFLAEPWAIPAWARLAEILPLALGAGWAIARRLGRDSRSRPSPPG